MADLPSIKQGDTYTKPFAVTADGQPQSLVGATLTLHLRAPGALVDTYTVALTVTDSAGGLALLTIPAATTATFIAGQVYGYEVEALTGAGQTITVAEGEVYIRPDRG